MNKVVESLVTPRKAAISISSVALTAIACLPSFAADFQPYTCGGAATFKIETLHEQEAKNFFSIDRNHIIGFDTRSGTVGYRVTNFPANCVLRPDERRAVRIIYDGCDIRKTTIKFKFAKADSGELVTIEFPLSAFYRSRPWSHAHDYYEASMSTNDILKGHAETLNLKEILVFTTTGMGEFGKVTVIGTSGDTKWYDLITDNGGCDFNK